MAGPVRELARTLLSFAATRTKLASAELEEQVIRLTEILIWLAFAYFFLGAGMLLAAVAIVLFAPNPLLAAVLIAGAFLAAGGFGALVARRRMRERPEFLAATLAELERDRERMNP